MNKLRKHFFWVNLLIFQSAWFIAIFLRDSGTLPLLALLCAHFWLTRSRAQDLLRIATVLPLGVMLDGGLALFNLVEFEGAWAMPVWLVLLWCHFSVSLNHGLQWLWSLPKVVIVLFGAIGGPMTYWGGAKLGAAELIEPWVALGIMTIAWGAIVLYAAYLTPRLSAVVRPTS